VDLIAFGSVFLEVVFGRVGRLPGPGEEVFSDEFAISCGGVVTVAAAARRAGASAGVSTVLGDDVGSRVVVEYCRREGVETGPCRRVRGPAAGITVVMNFDGDRAFLSHLPRRPPGEPTELERWIEVLRSERPAWCYLHAGPGVAPLIGEAHALGVAVALDVNLGAIEAAPADVVDCARVADLFVPNEAELMRLTGSAGLDRALEAASTWCDRLVVKRGERGALVVQDGRVAEVAGGLRPVQVRDRTGAGDAFAGAMIAALVGEASLEEAVSAGNAAGSEAVARLGAVGEIVIDGLTADARQSRGMDRDER
jgi:sugar/nucleoside kinase (ribokinase family)